MHLKKHGLILLILMSMTALFIVERAFLMVPWILYFWIGIILFSVLLYVVAILFFRNRHLSFQQQFMQGFNKVVFVDLAIMSLTLWISAAYATFWMQQAKNQGLLVLLWLLALVLTPNSYTYQYAFKKNRKSLTDLRQVFSFLMCLLGMFLMIFITYRFSGMNVYRLILGCMLVVFYVFFNQKGENKYENS